MHADTRIFKVNRFASKLATFGENKFMRLLKYIKKQIFPTERMELSMQIISTEYIACISPGTFANYKILTILFLYKRKLSSAFESYTGLARLTLFCNISHFATK